MISMMKPIMYRQKAVKKTNATNAIKIISAVGKLEESLLSLPLCELLLFIVAVVPDFSSLFEDLAGVRYVTLTQPYLLLPHCFENS
jgi:hypothetical protein